MWQCRQWLHRNRPEHAVPSKSRAAHFRRADIRLQGEDRTACVHAEQAVQGILAGVTAGCSRHLCSVHLGFLLRLSCVCLHGNAATIQRFQFCSGFDVVPPLKNLRFIGERKQQVMSLENRLHCFQNVLTGTISVPAEGVHLPFRGLEFALHSGQSGVNAPCNPCNIGCGALFGRKRKNAGCQQHFPSPCRSPNKRG